MEYTIQHLVFPTLSKHLQCRELFYRGDNGYLDTESKTLTLGCGQMVDFTTYLNACSFRKWRKYTCAEHLKIHIDIEGSYSIVFNGYDYPQKNVLRTDCGIIKEEGASRKIIEFSYPNTDTQLFGFELTAIDKCTIYGGYYTVECDESQLQDVNLSIATTTHRKEDFIKNNVELIKDEILNKHDDFSEHLFLHVTDNGRTLSEEDIHGHHVYLHPNNNSGGAGGFARGMIESLHQTPAATHVLLMDDDVLILPESLRRTYALLKLLKKEFRDSFISGAMLFYEEPFRQHEDIGTITANCEFRPRKPEFDHRFIASNLENEDEYLKQPNEYSAWWYCCIPVQVIKRNGLPLPVFIRCDDAEYGMRCKANIITMNGICIWHMGFVRKYNAVMDKYQSCRNLLIGKASTGILEGVDVEGMVFRSFRLQIMKYNYDAAELILRSFRDYLKGPDFLKVDRGEELIKENSKLNDEMVPLDNFTDVSIPDLFECYAEPSRGTVKKWLYRATYNGQVLIPDAFMKKEPALVAFDHTYQPARMAFHDKHLEVNPFSQTGRMLTIDKKRFRSLWLRFARLRAYYRTHKAEIINKYRAEKDYLISEEFWRKYLKLQ